MSFIAWLDECENPLCGDGHRCYACGALGGNALYWLTRYARVVSPAGVA